jgi:hypothetical protein
MRNEFSNAIDEREGSIAKKIAGRLLAGVISASLICNLKDLYSAHRPTIISARNCAYTKD